MIEPRITFRVSASATKYGDGKTFFDHKIFMIHRDKVVGVEHGKRRTNATRSDALKAARTRISVLRTHKLFPIRVTRKHISDGQARQCTACAIAQALWHNQEAMGFPKRNYEFRVSPYGAFCDPEGIVCRPTGYGDDAEERSIPFDKLPEMVMAWSTKRGRSYVYYEGMVEWAMSWDEWAEARYVTAKEYREENSEEDKPGRPGACSFVLDLSEMEPMKGH